MTYKLEFDAKCASIEPSGSPEYDLTVTVEISQEQIIGILDSIGAKNLKEFISQRPNLFK